MNNWLKIGVPILIVVLLVISAVSITIAVTRGSTTTEVAALYSGDKEQGAVNTAYCQNCPQSGQTDSDDAQAGAASQAYIPKAKQGSCCVTSQGTTSSQTFRGSCCGAR